MHLTPNLALLLLTAGLLLIYGELNRPGRILPGALGLTATLFALFALAHEHPAPATTVLVLSAIALFTLDLLRPTRPAVAAAATLALACGLPLLTHPRPNPALAVACALALGVTTSLLTRIARRARANKRVN